MRKTNVEEHSEHCGTRVQSKPRVAFALEAILFFVHMSQARARCFSSLQEGNNEACKSVISSGALQGDGRYSLPTGEGEISSNY